MSKEDTTGVLVLGAGGMLGNAIFRYFFSSPGFAVTGTLRTPSKARFFSEEQRPRLISGIDVTSDTALETTFANVKPAIVINCVGIIKQLAQAKDPIAALTINALLPHRIAVQCKKWNARLVHMSTDCVFSGRKGGYFESDFADANDLYGRSKYLGETNDAHTVTLRTSIIGHELGSAYSLIDWFLSQQGSVRGYSKAIFSGLPTIEIARVIREFVITHHDMSGMYHLSAEPISKSDLLALVAQCYGKDTTIVPDTSVIVDRSLNSSRFREETGYAPPPWPDLVTAMYRDYLLHCRTARAD